MKVIVAIRHATNNGARPRVAALCSRAVLLGAALVCGAVITLLVAGEGSHRLTGVGVLGDRSGGIVPVSTGLAFAQKLAGDGGIVTVCIGDGTL